MSEAPASRRIALGSGLVADVLVKGQGEPLLFLHPDQGRSWSGFLDGLAERYTVYAPLTPGAVEPEELMSFDGFSDLALFYDDLLRALAVDTVTVIGHGFGGMVAAEFAAFYPERVSKLILIGALGLWQDETPVADIAGIHPSKLPALMFSDPEGPAASEVLKESTPEERGAFWLRMQLALGAASHFYWPIPDRDLKRRLYRITAPTLLLWGTEDRLVSPVYAEAFAAGIGQTKTVLVEGGSHFVHLEKTGEVLDAIAAFARDGVREMAEASR